MTKEQLAEQINGTEYRDEVSQLHEQAAKQHGLVIVFGYSDDNMEFRGAINDEVGCYEGGTALVDSKGLLPERDNIDDDETLEDYFKRKSTAKEIKAVWCPKDGNGEIIASWAYETKIPHAVFDVVEDDELYCKGIVFSLSDL
jgi:hypothetical protein